MIGAEDLEGGGGGSRGEWVHDQMGLRYTNGARCRWRGWSDMIAAGPQEQGGVGVGEEWGAEYC